MQMAMVSPIATTLTGLAPSMEVGMAGCRDTEWACVMEAVQDSRTERGVVR